VDDGRHFLAVTSERYDAITSEPPPPVFAGVVNLYTREYYAQAKATLRPGGVLSQWLPIFQLTGEETLSIASAMAAEFAWVGLWYGQADHLILLGSDRAPPLDGVAFAAFAAHARAPSLERDFARAGIAGVEDLFAGQLQSDEGLRRLVAEIEPLSDDRPTLQYPTRAIRAPAEVPPGLYGDPRALVSASQAGVGSAAMAIVQNALPSLTLSPIELHDLSAELFLRPALRLRPRHPSILGLLEADDGLVFAARTALEREPGRVDAAVELARRAFFDADWTAACTLLRPLGPAADARASLLHGGCARALGQAAEAATAFRRAAGLSADQGFRRYVQALAAQAGAPFLPEDGPLSIDTASRAKAP
jgi:hypothetical protein